MPKIFISYRREDSEYPALHIYEKLVEHFGKESVVFDVDTIPLGVNFRDYLSEEVSKCEILVTVIGDRWLDILKQRLKEPNDFVRIEIQAALERDIPLVPVLVKNASVPSATDLPPELSELAYKQATEVRAGSDYQSHLKRLINGLEHLLTDQPSPKDSTQANEKNAEPSSPESADKMEKRKVEQPSSEPTVEESSKREGTPAEIDKSRIGRKIIVPVLAAAALLVCLAAIVWFYLPPGEETGFEKEIAKSIESDVEKRVEPLIQEIDKEITKSELSDLPEITNIIGMKFVLIPAGSFTMGSPKLVIGLRPINEYQHPVTLTRPFYMQTTEVTQGQWQKVMGGNPSDFQDCGDNCPVENVSWKDAQRFIALLNKKGNVAHYRLPTEAEWEYACRAGSTTAFTFGDDRNGLGEYAWYQVNSSDMTHPVETRKPNAWGLYDMHGNVAEWVADWYDREYPIGPVTDPESPQSGRARVIRGGSYDNEESWCRSAWRGSPDPDTRLDSIGFRLAKSASLNP